MKVTHCMYPTRTKAKGLYVTRKNGFTLIELVLFMGIVTILLVVLTQIFGSVLDVQKESAAFSSVQQDGTVILNRLMYDITRADSVITPSSLGQKTTNLQFSAGGINYTYAILNGNLVLTDNIGTDQLNSYDSTVSNVSFLRLGNVGGKNTIQIAFTLTSRVQQAKGVEVRNFQTTIGLR